MWHMNAIDLRIVTGFMGLSFVQNSKYLENTDFQKMDCFRLKLRGGKHLLCWVS
jgi:hypothetical protein